MKRTVLPILLLAVSALLAACASIAPAPTPAPAPTLALPRAVEAAYAAGTRSPDGNPGPNYWQNTSVHDIQLTVMPPDRTIRGIQTITYTNNSPNELAMVPIRLYQNAHRPAALREDARPPEFFTDGVTIDSFKVNGQETPYTPEPGVPIETLHIIKLPQPIPAGGQATFEIGWHYEIANVTAKEGVVDPTTFAIAYFFPRVAPIRDDEYGAPIYPGFDTQDFTYRGGREFNNDFADFTVAVTVPKDYLVWATGELQNADEVLQPDAAKKYADSLTSDATITIATPEELAAGQITAQTDTVTWRWQAQGIPDFALGVSDHYIWDAGSVVGDPATGARVGVAAAYPASAELYTTMVQDQRDIITYASTEWPGVAWPWPRSTVFLGNGDEEWPMMANDSAGGPYPGATPRFVAAHELLHQYFPFAMGINEARYNILDEGWTTALEYFFNSHDLGQEMEDQLFSAFRGTVMTMPFSGMEIPAITPADSLRGVVAGDNAYGKASNAYLALRNLLGDEAFKAGLHAFMDRWQGKHPLPWDMFNTFNDVTGQDLNWFWHNWFYTDGYVDLALTGVNQTADGWTVDVNNTGGFAIPFTVVATYADGTTQAVEQGVATWQDVTAQTVTLPGEAEPMKVELQMGPFLDATPGDNAWVSPNAPVPASPGG